MVILYRAGETLNIPEFAGARRGIPLRSPDPNGFAPRRAPEHPGISRDFPPGIKPLLAVHRGADFRIPNCHEMVAELVWGLILGAIGTAGRAPVVLEGFGGQVWPKIGRKPEKNRIPNCQ